MLVVLNSEYVWFALLGIFLFPSLLLLFSSKLCPTHCDPVDCRAPDFPVLHYLPEFAQTHVH